MGWSRLLFFINPFIWEILLFMWEITSGPIKLGQVGFFSLGSSQNTQWTQVDQVHVAISAQTTYKVDWLKSWCWRNVGPFHPTQITLFLLWPSSLEWCYWHNSFPNFSMHHQFQEKKKKYKGCGIGLKGYFLIIFLKII